MAIDGWRSNVDTGTVRWLALERDWKTVVGVAIVALVAALELQIPR
ncbi:hypothetical protein HYG81_08180 [Natrinema zhouii]|uniref:Uncharacterized protein n=1 Tax=Natrinema zhouii TaxID=1710539 RepID=A0A7D6H550_9EURY|nr:hypothetical protein [Natrinema zhouii]QLK27567.1 hypothetical protein HYG81_08180 [Natrinema zhouii]